MNEGNFFLGKLRHPSGCMNFIAKETQITTGFALVREQNEGVQRVGMQSWKKKTDLLEHLQENSYFWFSVGVSIQLSKQIPIYIKRLNLTDYLFLTPQMRGSHTSYSSSFFLIFSTGLTIFSTPLRHSPPRCRRPRTAPFSSTLGSTSGEQMDSALLQHPQIDLQVDSEAAANQPET